MFNRHALRAVISSRNCIASAQQTIVRDRLGVLEAVRRQRKRLRQASPGSPRRRRITEVGIRCDGKVVATDPSARIIDEAQGDGRKVEFPP